MMQSDAHSPSVAIACGGTGGHLFPGLAVAEQLAARGCGITLMISSKDVDQKGVQSALNQRAARFPAGSETPRFDVVTLPAVGLSRGRWLRFARGFLESYRAAGKHFSQCRPQIALAMGGFTSAPPIVAARRRGAKTFLHESNTIPGRANRWLSRLVDHCFVGFPQAGERLKGGAVTVTGTPVRPQFQPRDAAECRKALGLNPDRPVLVVTGGSQGASGLNDLTLAALPVLSRRCPNLQLFHLTGPNDGEKVRVACAAAGISAVVHPFFPGMELALGAATAVMSRAGASSLAEIAAMRVPAVLIPFPAATDDHQMFNARAFAGTGAALMLEQRGATTETLVGMLLELLENETVRSRIRAALAEWHSPHAAERIAEMMLSSVLKRGISKGEPVASGPGAREGFTDRNGRAPGLSLAHRGMSTGA